MSPTVIPRSPVTSGSGERTGRQASAPLSSTATLCRQRFFPHSAKSAKPLPSAAKSTPTGLPGSPDADGIRGGFTPSPAAGSAAAPEDPADETAADPLGDYLDSLERIGRLEPAEVLPA
ncbi:hypothetical protein O3Q52_38605, partial [Streptomyces sp. ActVer]|nr:hypothetical protein [Streptomyces sp. ActVer]